MATNIFQAHIIWTFPIFKKPSVLKALAEQGAKYSEVATSDEPSFGPNDKDTFAQQVKKIINDLEAIHTSDDSVIWMSGVMTNT
jgi:hypothetical protein